MNNKVNSFTFYYDYYYLVDTMPIEDKKELVVAILDYVFKDEMPSLNGHNQAIFNTLSHQLNVSKNKSKCASKENQIINQKKIKSKSNQNQTSKQNSILSFKFYISNLDINNTLKDKLNEWLDYKTEKNEKYKETGFKTLINRIIKASEEYGEQQVIDLIDECMGSNYKGIIFDKLHKQKKKDEPIIPSWFNNQPVEEKKEIDAEDLKELEGIMKEFK